jgi:hypothetical protein
MSDPSSPASALTKILVEFEYHWSEIAAESFWAQPLGNDRYELRNVPFYAYGLNYGDIVVATKQPTDELPVIERVERSSGHQTFRIVPADDVDTVALLAALDALEAIGVGVERASPKLMALDIAPDVDSDVVFDRLEELEADGMLEFETCERQVDDGFGSERTNG